jgi:hypothetical protein
MAFEEHAQLAGLVMAAGEERDDRHVATAPAGQHLFQLAVARSAFMWTIDFIIMPWPATHQSCMVSPLSDAQARGLPRSSPRRHQARSAHGVMLWP